MSDWMMFFPSAFLPEIPENHSNPLIIKIMVQTIAPGMEVDTGPWLRPEGV